MNAPAPASPRRRLVAGDRELELGARPWLMGIVNASPDSFSDGGRHATLDRQVELAAELLAAGADILDVGGQSARADRPRVSALEELERVLPLVERLAGELGALVSVDTYRPSVARAAIAAGARIVNDVSGLRDADLAAACAETGAALVLMHTLAEPGRRLQDRALYGEDIAGEDRVDQLALAQPPEAVEAELVGDRMQVGERAGLQLGALEYCHRASLLGRMGAARLAAARRNGARKRRSA